MQIFGLPKTFLFRISAFFWNICLKSNCGLPNAVQAIVCLRKGQRISSTKTRIIVKEIGNQVLRYVPESKPIPLSLAVERDKSVGGIIVFTNDQKLHPGAAQYLAISGRGKSLYHNLKTSPRKSLKCRHSNLQSNKTKLTRCLTCLDNPIQKADTEVLPTIQTT